MVVGGHGCPVPMQWLLGNEIELSNSTGENMGLPALERVPTSTYRQLM